MDWWNPAIAVTGLLVGIVVGLTGMGGGALMTPILVFFFGVSPLAAVSSDVVASLFMKPIGGVVHLRRGTVHLGLVKWLCVGSVPGAFLGVLLLRFLGEGEDLQEILLTALGVVLVLASLAIVPEGLPPAARPRTASRTRSAGGAGAGTEAVRVNRPATVLVGACGGADGRDDLRRRGFADDRRPCCCSIRRSGPGNWWAPTWCRRSRWSPRRRSGISCSATSASA